MQEFCPGSTQLGEIACFYLSDITGYLRKRMPTDGTVKLSDDGSDIQQTIMFIGGWSKTDYLTEINLFYPSEHRLTKWGSS